MSASQILIIDDEPAIVDVVEYVLQEDGFQVSYAADGTSGLSRIRTSPPDLVLLDLNLPGLSGLDLFREIRKSDEALPVIMLTSRADEVDRILGLELGADDYVTKPFSPRELAARVRAVLRRNRAAPDPSHSPLLSVGPLMVNPDAFSCTCFGVDLALTRAEFGLIHALVRNPARVYRRGHLLDIIYDDTHAVTDRSVDALVKRLRKKFHEVREAFDPIETVYGVGYKLCRDLENHP